MYDVAETFTDTYDGCTLSYPSIGIARSSYDPGRDMEDRYSLDMTADIRS